MAHPILMPKPGQMTEECVLVAWHKREGDPVRRGDILFEIETDKSNMEVEAFDDGVLLRRYVGEGETVPVNSVCAYVGEPGEAVPDEAPAMLGQPSPMTPAPDSGSEPPSTPPTAPGPGPRPAAPHGAVQTAAPGVRPTRGSFGAAVPSLVIPGSATPRLRISPRASRLAAEAGVDPRTIVGTGPDGRIVERDVVASVALGAQPSGPQAASIRPTEGAPGAGAPSAATLPMVEGEGPPRPLTRMRRVIAERLTLSVTTIPHFTVTVAADVTSIASLRTELKGAGTSLTMTDFVLAAAAQSLVEFPDVNARTDGISVWPRSRVHLGVAVALPAGLVVPVIRDADRLGIREIHERAAWLAAAAREGRLGVDDMTGSTFTVSNLGMHGVEEFSAIINPGESAILAVGAAQPTPVAVGGGIAVRTIMRLTLSADHRLVDGELGARFLNAVRRRLLDAEAFRWELAAG